MEAYADQLFQAATGWLGWSAEAALTTPIPQIELAIDGRIDWVKKTNPWGGAEEEPEPETPEAKAERLKAALRSFKR